MISVYIQKYATVCSLCFLDEKKTNALFSPLIVGDKNAGTKTTKRINIIVYHEFASAGDQLHFGTSPMHNSDVTWAFWHRKSQYDNSF